MHASLLKCLGYGNGRKAVTEAEFQEFLELAACMHASAYFVEEVVFSKS